ncbi:MAG: hypothetical protein ABI315_02655 [Bacteroidia bacterium]
MRLILLLSFLYTAVANGQTKIYDLNKLDSINFTNFITDKKVIVVGEMHGTTEVPLFVLQLIKQLKKSQKKLTVGLEIPINYQKEINDFMKSGDFEKLKKLDHFKYPDGRTSIAMGQLIKGLRELSGVKTICFDIDTNLRYGINRDSLMGVNLSESYRDGQMVILTGNLHANLKEGYWRPNFKSATYYFNMEKKFNDKLISLNTYYGGGTIWNCMEDGCKERDAGSNGGNVKQSYGFINFIGIYDGVHPSGYSGFIYWDKVTASKPMVK